MTIIKNPPPNAKVKKVITPDLTLRYCTYVKNAFVLALREAFGDPSTPEEYRYSPDLAKSQISIFRVFPKRAIKYPALIVSTDPGDASITSLGGNEAAYDVWNDDNTAVTGVVYMGRMYIPVTITVYAQTATDRERLTDLVTIYCRYVFKAFFDREQMPFLDIRAGENGEDVKDNIVLYRGIVTIQLQTEFDQFIDQSLWDKVMAINLKDLLVGSSQADLQPNTEP